MTSALRAQAAAVGAVVRELRGQVDAAHHPSRRALESLGVTSLGWTPTIYGDAAFDIWARQVRRDPSDSEAIHHLAIMHHARAIDREQSEDPLTADDDWQAAADYWFRLWQDDGFWQRLAETARAAKPTIIAEVRARLPEDLLGLHYQIALDPQTRRSRCNYHVRFALATRFPEATKESVRTRAYERHAQRIPDTIWQTLAPGAADVGEALAIIKDFVERDPGCSAAIADAVSIMVRLMRTRATELHALDGDASGSRAGLLRELLDLHATWGPYVEPLLTNIDTLRDATRRDLAVWYRVLGEVASELGHEDRAEALYSHGADAGAAGDHDREICRRRHFQVQAMRARRLAQAGDAHAGGLCERLAAHPDLPPLARLLLANAFMLLEQFESARRVCVMHEDAADASFDFVEEDAQARVALAEFAITVDAEEALAHSWAAYRDNRFEEALARVDAAIAIRDARALSHLLRARCLIALARSEEAGAALAAYRMRAGGEDATNELAEQTSRELADLDAAVIMFGSVGQRLVREARQLQSTDPDAAIERLVRARELANERGRSQIDGLHGDMLIDRAVDLANGRPRDLAVLRDAAALLDRAVELTSGGERALQNQRALHANIDARIARMRQEATLAFHADDLDFAVRRLADCHAHAADDHKNEIGTELATVAGALAAKMVNVGDYPLLDVGDFIASASTRDVFDTATALLQRARELDPASQQHTQNLEAVQQLRRQMQLLEGR